jgi:hypothetical protein
MITQFSLVIWSNLIHGTGTCSQTSAATAYLKTKDFLTLSRQRFQDTGHHSPSRPQYDTEMCNEDNVTSRRTTVLTSTAQRMGDTFSLGLFDNELSIELRLDLKISRSNLNIDSFNTVYLIIGFRLTVPLYEIVWNYSCNYQIEYVQVCS